MPQKCTTWFCVADAGTARIKQSTSPVAPLTSITTLNRAPYEHGRYEEPGRSQESVGSARHAFQDADGPIRREKREFAEIVADFLDEAAARGAYQRLILAAPPKFLGDLRASLGPKAHGMVAGEVDKDLTKESDAELAERLSELASVRG
jgi:protein required for attachment to host cells